MTILFQAALFSLALLPPALAWAQVDQSVVGPSAAPGFRLPTLAGSLVYALNLSQNVSTGFYNKSGASASTNISGDAAYLSQSLSHPFSVIYSGAVLAGNSNQPTSVVQNLALSQVLIKRLWSVTATDAVSYLPSTATTGLSGVAGLGDLGVDPVETGPVTGQGVLTGNAPRVTNSSTASIVRSLGRTSLNGSGSYVVQRFTGDEPGLFDSNQAVGSIGASQILDARSSLNAGYSLSKITYSPNTASSFNVQSANFGYSRQFTRSLLLDAMLGPQWTKTFFAGEHTSLSLATDVNVRLTTRTSVIAGAYVRGTNNGFGVIPGGFSDSLNASGHRTFFRTWSGSVTANYTRTSNPVGLHLPVYALDTLVAGVQVARSLSRSLSTYVSYNAQHQSTGAAADTSRAFQGLYNIVAFGLTYSPRTLSLGAR